MITSVAIPALVWALGVCSTSQQLNLGVNHELFQAELASMTLNNPEQSDFYNAASFDIIIHVK